MHEEKTRRRYLSREYLAHNPTWDIEDSPWKAQRIREILVRNGIDPKSIVEVGCGAGGVLADLRRYYSGASLHGYDIAPDASQFWSQHSWANITFTIGDFLETAKAPCDLLLLLDVIEHLENPFEFLTQLRQTASRFVFHIPLDLSASTVLRETPLLRVREKVGHIHYFTKGLALELLADCGFEVTDWQYTGASLTAPRRTWATRLASVLRRMAYAVDKDAGVRLLGGETLLVLARTRKG